LSFPQRSTWTAAILGGVRVDRRGGIVDPERWFFRGGHAVPSTPDFVGDWPHELEGDGVPRSYPNAGYRTSTWAKFACSATQMTGLGLRLAL
jgi:hypothetical protein